MSPALYYVHADHTLKPQKITDASDAVVWDGVFTPFGQPYSITGSLSQNIRFPAQYADAETGRFYNWHRDYDPTLGRYIQSDPMGLAAGINTYSYAPSNPPLPKSQILQINPAQV